MNATEAKQAQTSELSTWKIWSKDGVYFGVYEADSIRGAVEAMCRDAGYSTLAEAAAVTATNAEAFIAELEIERS